MVTKNAKWMILETRRNYKLNLIKVCNDYSHFPIICEFFRVLTLTRDSAKIEALMLQSLPACLALLCLNFDLKENVISSWVFPPLILGVPPKTDKSAIWVIIFVTWTPVVYELNWSHKLIPYNICHNLHYLIQFPTATGNKNKVSCDYKIILVTQNL